jgi:hypothetical protein
LDDPSGWGVEPSGTGLAEPVRWGNIRPMFSLYAKVIVTAARYSVNAWPTALALVVYGGLFLAASIVAQSLGFLGGILMWVVAAACWSSYLELIAQAVAGSRVRLRWAEFKKTFATRFWDVVSVMFAFFIIRLVTNSMRGGDNGAAASAILAIAIAFFFNAVPELLYQGHSRSFALLIDSGRFMLANPVAWLLPNLVFAAAALAASGGLRVHHPAELLITFGNTFSSPTGVVGLFAGMPIWALPIALFGVHYVMIFRGLLFAALTGGTTSARMRAFRASQR